MIKQGDVLTLDDDKNYSVAYVTILNANNYAFLVDQEDYTNTMFCRYDSSGLEEIVEPEVIEQLLNNFVNN